MMDWVTRVAMNASSLSSLTMKALHRPTTPPTTIVISRVGKKPTPFETSSALSTPRNATSAPGDRSFWPSMIR